MIQFETEIRIERDVEDVFDYVSDPLNFSQWNSAVRSVRPTSSPPKQVGSTYVMERQLPNGRAVNDLEILTVDRPREFVMHTTSGPTPLTYRYRFASLDGATDMRFDAEVELPGIASLAGPLARRAVKSGVDDNFATLKSLLQTAAGSGRRRESAA